MKNRGGFGIFNKKPIAYDPTNQSASNENLTNEYTGNYEKSETNFLGIKKRREKNDISGQKADLERNIKIKKGSDFVNKLKEYQNTLNEKKTRLFLIKKNMDQISNIEANLSNLIQLKDTSETDVSDFQTENEKLEEDFNKLKTENPMEEMIIKNEDATIINTLIKNIKSQINNNTKDIKKIHEKNIVTNNNIESVCRIISGGGRHLTKRHKNKKRRPTKKYKRRH